MINKFRYSPTNDKIIRHSLKEILLKDHQNEQNTVITEELNLRHGEVRIDVAVVNGIIHGYELKSDLDTLGRLPSQMNVYNSVLDQVTIVVGKNHLHHAFRAIPDWWGVMVAKIIDIEGEVQLLPIREARDNPYKDSLSVARLLLKEEAVMILEEIGKAKDLRTKSREFVYEYLVQTFNQADLRKKIREQLVLRIKKKSGLQRLISDD